MPRDKNQPCIPKCGAHQCEVCARTKHQDPRMHMAHMVHTSHEMESNSTEDYERNLERLNSRLHSLNGWDSSQMHGRTDTGLVANGWGIAIPPRRNLQINMPASSTTTRSTITSSFSSRGSYMQGPSKDQTDLDYFPMLARSTPSSTPVHRHGSFFMSQEVDIASGST